ncbi:hypothetical protein AZSI13_31280 [Azospira sp. I13]|nr:hypothetical protein AZSI13_31280 [Azospira sp. I13]
MGFSPVGAGEPQKESPLKAIALNNPLTAIGEAALNLGSQAVALPLAGLAGLATETGNALGLTEKRGADVVHQVGEGMTYLPRGDMGRQAAGIATYPLEKLAEAGQWLGGKTLAATGSPLAATAVDTAVNVAPMLLDPALRPRKRGGATDAHSVSDVTGVEEGSRAGRQSTIGEKSGPLEDYSPIGAQGVVKEAQVGADPGRRVDDAATRIQEHAPGADRPTIPADDMLHQEVIHRQGNGAPVVIDARDGPLSEAAVLSIRANKPEQGSIPLDPARAVAEQALSDEPMGTSFSASLEDGALKVKRGPGESISNETLNSSIPGQSDFAPGANYVPLRDDASLPAGAGSVAELPAPMRRENIIRDFTRALDSSLYEGRVTGKNRLGFFRPGVEEVRIKRANDLEVAAHEMAHLIDFRDPDISRAVRSDKELTAEMRGISYDQSKLAEGFAEGVRLWMTQPDALVAKAPKVAAFLDRLSASHPYGSALKKAQADMTAWFGQDALSTTT